MVSFSEQDSLFFWVVQHMKKCCHSNIESTTAFGIGFPLSFFQAFPFFELVKLLPPPFSSQINHWKSSLCAWNASSFYLVHFCHQLFFFLLGLIFKWKKFLLRFKGSVSLSSLWPFLNGYYIVNQTECTYSAYGSELSGPISRATRLHSQKAMSLLLLQLLKLYNFCFNQIFIGLSGHLEYDIQNSWTTGGTTHINLFEAQVLVVVCM